MRGIRAGRPGHERAKCRSPPNRDASTVRPNGSHGIRPIVILMMENRSFDHFLGWLPGADGRHDLTFVSAGLRPLAASRA
jgi:phospholipase C